MADAMDFVVNGDSAVQCSEVTAFEGITIGRGDWPALVSLLKNSSLEVSRRQGNWEAILLCMGVKHCLEADPRLYSLKLSLCGGGHGRPRDFALGATGDFFLG